MGVGWQRGRFGGAVLTATLLAGASPLLAAARDPFPEPRPSTRTDAARLVTRAQHPPGGCLTAPLERARSLGDANLAVRRAVAMLQGRAPSSREQWVVAAHGTRVRYSTDGALDSVPSQDHDRDGQPDVVQAVVAGLDQARTLLVDVLQLASPESVQVQFVELGDGYDGYMMFDPAQPTRASIILDATPEGGPDVARRAAAHQLAHAIAATSGSPMPWAEALATWTTLTLDGRPDGATASLLSHRLERLDAGLASTDLDLAAGNAIWLAFLEQSYGMHAVRLTVEELARGAATTEALGRAVERATGQTLGAAFREFHLWTLLVGRETEHRHFSFAGSLAPPGFASEAIGLPALSVLSDPPLAPWGAAQIRVQPESRDGGLRFHFEGEFPAEWEADLILVDGSGVLRRLPLSITPEGHGQTTVPLHGVAEAVLLVRNLGSDDGAPRRYTYAAHRERGFPFEITSLEAAPAGSDKNGVLVSWETSSEQQMLGFNLIREREDNPGGPRVTVNPIWIPAVGEAGGPTWYHFLDPAPQPGAPYLYRIEGVTVHGLTSLSDPVLFRRP